MTSLTTQTRTKKIDRLVVISLVSFLFCFALLALMIWKAEKLTVLGLTGNVYYVALVPLGLSAAVLLFGVLRSSASYRGHFLGGVLVLGGPVVVFLLVEILGFVLVKSPFTFPLTVYIHGEHGQQDLVLRNSGQVVLRLGPESRRQPIGADGQTYFPAIPANFRDQYIFVWVESEDFETTGETRHQIAGPSIDVTVQRKSKRVSGRVQDQKGNPVSGAQIHVAGISTQTDAAGRFELDIPRDRVQPQLELDVLAQEYQPVHLSVVPNSNPAVVTLTPLR